MASPIEDYALLSDTESAALVGRDGSIDWLTFPRFDSPACFSALLGTPEHGRWMIAPAHNVDRVERAYRPGTLVLETTSHTSEGVVRLVDCMPVRDETLQVVRRIEGVSGSVTMRIELVVRPDYGSIVPWVRREGDRQRFVAGPDALMLSSPVRLEPDGWRHVAEVTVAAGDTFDFEMAWYPSSEPAPEPEDVGESIARTTDWWECWSASCRIPERWGEVVRSSLTVLKGLTYDPTGGIVAAPTTSLPETLGGERNWDYRYCWLRDATFTLLAFIDAGYTDEAAAWRRWLLRAVAGRPDQVQIMYGPAGERRLPEMELPWLPGYEGSSPVRIGNAAHGQLQIDVFGEVLDALHQAAVAGIGDPDGHTWPLATALVERLAEVWSEPDDGIWEVRGGRRHFTHSKVMAWVAVDRALRWAEAFDLEAPVERWEALRHEIHAEVLARGVDERGVFTQTYDSPALDASVLLVPIVGFLPPDDPRVTATIDAIADELTEDGLVLRYRQDHTDDGLEGTEGVFLLCSFWMVQALALNGRVDEAEALYERLVGLRNDVGLLAEEWDPHAGRMLGNFPQAFSHIGLVECAMLLSGSSRAQSRALRPN
ncbi:MAG: glycoside hydrolase family 15 protein [Iamia sp.]